MVEEWRDIQGYEGLYQVSNLGRVKSLERKVKHSKGGYALKKGKILNQSYDKDGYLQLHLCKEGISKKFFIHRLVAITFIPNPNNYEECNHIDENKENNCVSNLEWVTHKDNCNWGTRIERVTSKKSIPVVAYKDGVEVMRFSSQWEAEREGGFDQGSISDCCRGKIKKHKGYEWKKAI